MVRAKTIVPAPKKRIRRTEEQLIADLQAEIGRLKGKAAAAAAKKDPSTRHTAAAVRSIDQALATATSATHREALTEARTLLVAYLQLEGVKIPQRRGPKGRRARATSLEQEASNDTASEDSLAASA